MREKEELRRQSATPTSRFYYLRGALGDGSLLEEHKAIVRGIFNGDYAESDLERLKGTKDVWSFRTSKKARLLFTFTKMDGEDYLVLLDYLPNHEYHKSRFLQRGVLKQYLERQQEEFQALIEEESEELADLEAWLFEPSSSEELKERLVPIAAGANFDAVVLDYYQHRMVELNLEQERARTVQLPAVISGVAGSGKSCVAFSLMSSYLLSHAQPVLEEGAGKEKEKESPPLKLLYVSQSARLVQTMEKSWQHLPETLQKAQVDFKTYQQLLEKEGLAGQHAAGFTTFSAWYKEHTTRIKKAARAKGTTFSILAPAMVYQECRIRSGYSAEEYLQLGSKQSQLNRGERAWLNEVYEHYKVFLHQTNQFAPEFSSLTQGNCYDLVVVDEAQDLSHLQLVNLNGLARDKGVVYCMDSHQRLFDARSVRPYLLQKLDIAESSHIELNVMYRCPPKVLAVANEVIAFKHRLVGGTADRNEPTQIKEATYSDDSKGHVHLLDRSMLSACSWMREPLGTNFAVVTLEANREEAKRYFNTPLIFTPEEIKGLEYDVVVAFRLYPSGLFKEAQQRIKILPPDKQPIHQPKSGKRADQFTTGLNNIYTSYTRAKKALIICEDFTPVNELLLAHLRPIADKGLPSKEGLQQNNYSDWQQEAANQKAAGNSVLAQVIEETKLNQPLAVGQATGKASVYRGRHRGKEKATAPAAVKAAAAPTPKAPVKTVPKANPSREEVNALELFNHFDEKRFAVGLRILDITALLLKPYHTGGGAKTFILLEKLIQDKQMAVLLRCAANDLTILSKLPCEQLLAYLKKHQDKPHREAYKQLARLYPVQKKINYMVAINSDYIAHGYTPASVAVIQCNVANLELLRELGAELDKPNKVGETPAHIAAYFGNETILKLLHDCGVSLDTPAKDGTTAAYNAAVAGYDKILRLLHNWGARLDIPVSNGGTAVHAAASKGHDNVLILLRKLGANFDGLTKEGFPPAYFAVQNGHVKVLKLFHDWGIRLDKPLYNSATLVHAATQHGRMEVLKLFHDLGIRLDTPTKSGITPVHVAVQCGQIEALKLLHHWRVKLDTLANNGETPAFVAALHGNTKIIRLLKKWGLKLDTPAANGIAPMHMAAGNGHEEILTLFHEWGIKLDMPASDGGTPALFAAEGGYVSSEVISQMGYKSRDANKIWRNTRVYSSSRGASRGHSILDWYQLQYASAAYFVQGCVN